MIEITPQEELEKLSYKELLERKNNMFSFITEFENDFEMEKFRWDIHPKPNIIYQVYLEELGRILPLLAETFRKEYVMSDKDMKDYYKDMKKKIRKIAVSCYNRRIRK